MGLRINTNILSANAQRNLGSTTRLLSRAMERLSSGQRVNSARDDAAGMAIGTGLEAQRRGMVQAIRNLNDARGFLSTAEGALQTQTDIIQRMRELAIQSANGTLGASDRAYLNGEVQQLLEEFNRITNQTQFNGTSLLDGSFTTRGLQVGTKKGEGIDFSISSMAPSSVFVSRATSGDGTFSARTTITIGGSQTQSLVSGDINGDGKLDLLAANYGSDTVSIALGRGDGTFQTRTTLTTGSGPYSATLTDFNGDGKLDIVSNDYFNATVSVFIGNGNGTFASRVTSTVGSQAYHVAAGDFSGDGKMDLVTADQGDNAVSILIGNGNGTFQTRTTLSTGGGSSPRFVTTGDLNADGKQDIIVADNSTASLSVFLGNGNGTFGSEVSLTVGGSPRSVSVVDVNGDGKVDLVSGDGASSTASILLGNGNGTFKARTTIATGGGNRITAVDMNGDSSIDIISADNTDSTISIAFGNGDGTFKTRSTLSTGSGPFNVIALDLNADGAMDLVDTDNGTTTASIFLGRAVLKTTNPAVTITTQTTAANMLEVFDNALAYINSARSNIGALQSRLDFAESVGQSLVENLSGARSQMLDADFAAETAEFTKLQILQQAGIAVLGQANMNAQLTLKLLQNL